MKQEKKYILQQEAVSNYKDRKGNYIVLGKRGDVVTEIAEHGELLIVMNKHNDRFQVRRDILQQI